MKTKETISKKEVLELIEEIIGTDEVIDSCGLKVIISSFESSNLRIKQRNKARELLGGLNQE